MVDRLLLENGTDRYLLEDGSGVVLLEPPQLTVTPFQVASWTTTTTPKTIAVTGALNGDLVLVMYGGDNFGGAVTAATASTTGGTTSAWTELEEFLAVGTNAAWLSAAWADVTADGDVTVSLARTQGSGKLWGGFALLCRNHGGIGVHGNSPPSAAETESLTVAEGSAVAALGIDWDALAEVAFSPAGAADVLRDQIGPSPDVTVYAGYWLNQAAGTRGYGIGTSSTTALHLNAIEILKATAAGPTVVDAATETDTATALVERKATTVAQSTEVATAGVVTAGHRRIIGQATETATATALVELKRKAVGQATETATASAPVEAKRRILAQASETDTATAVAIVAGGVVGRASEVDTATTVARSKALGVSRAVETGTGTPVTPRKLRAVQAATELATATALVELKRKILGQASETDTGTATVRRKLRAVGRASEVDTAGGIQRPGQVGRAFELDTATLPVERKARAVGQATETATGGGLVRRIKTAAVGRAIELATATGLFKRKLKTLSRATETATATPLVERKVKPLTGAIELNSARVVAGGGLVAILGVASENESAYAIRFRFVTPRPSGATTDPALGSVTRPGTTMTLPGATGVTPRPSGATTPGP
jgi:hypothetical protein